MCKRTIVDVNAHEIVCGNGTSDSDLLGWLRRREGILCYTATGKFHEELSRTRSYQLLLRTWLANKTALLVSGEELTDAGERLRPHLPGLVSDDSHILELAIASGVEVLVTRDRKLTVDFKAVMGKATGKPKKSFSVYPVGGAANDGNSSCATTNAERLTAADRDLGRGAGPADPPGAGESPVVSGGAPRVVAQVVDQARLALG